MIPNKRRLIRKKLEVYSEEEYKEKKRKVRELEKGKEDYFTENKNKKN